MFCDIGECGKCYHSGPPEWLPPFPGARTRAEPLHPGFNEPLLSRPQLRRLGPVHCAPDKWRMSSICSVWPWLIMDNRRSCPRLYQVLWPQSTPATSPASAELPFENFITRNNACSLWGLRVRFSHALSHHMLTNNLYSYWALSHISEPTILRQVEKVSWG